MIALREVHQVESDTITITLPAEFHAKRVEVVVRSLEEPSVAAQQLKEYLLTAPTLSDEELENYNEVRKWMNQWAVPDF